MYLSFLGGTSTGVAPIGHLSVAAAVVCMCVHSVTISAQGSLKMSADTSTRCECRSLGCAGWVSRRCEAQPQVCKNAGCECAFHSSASSNRKRGKHSQASRHSYFVSQDAASHRADASLNGEQ